MSTSDPRRDRRLAARLSEWFRTNARELPWRSTPRDPWRSFVSEAMLQQTQVSRVAERFEGFMRRFPSPAAMARAREQSVLAEWSGLGYYRRARNLHAAARAIAREHAGSVPRDVEALMGLPGVGRYTAGAIASIVFGERVPAVDGNVQRVLLRIDGEDRPPGEPSAARWAWERAEALVRVAEDPGLLNEGLMELGATVCTPGRPRCEACPVSRSCRARRAGMERLIPRARRRGDRRVIFHSALVVRDPEGRVLVEQRGSGGLWAGLWQAPTLEREDRPAAGVELRRLLGQTGSSLRVRKVEAFSHLTSHREVRFEVWEAITRVEGDPPRGRFLGQRELASRPLATPHRRILLGS